MSRFKCLKTDALKILLKHYEELNQGLLFYVIDSFFITLQ